MSFLKPSVPKRFYQPNIIFETVPPTAKISHLGHMNMYTNIKKAKQNKEKTGEYRQRRKQENIFKKDGEKMRKERSEGERQEVAEEEENIIVLAFCLFLPPVPCYAFVQQKSCKCTKSG